MTPPPVNGTLPLGGVYDVRPRGSLTLSEPRDLLVDRSTPGASGPDGAIATDTVRALLEIGFTGPLPKGPTADDVVRVSDEEVVWGGNLIGQYGHFLTESVARLWPVLPGAELDGRAVVFATPKKSPWVVDWLQAFGGRVVDLPERGAVRFTRMFVPEPALRHGAWIAPEIRDIHLHARQGMDVDGHRRHDVLWLSRSRLARHRVPYDHLLLEWLLGDHVTAVNLETMTLAEQVAALERSRGVAGVMGSAFHTLLMAAEQPECLYLCPPWDKQAYPAQHRVLDGHATFVHALDIAASRRRAREGVPFPGAYRLLIPEALEALRATLLPDLFDDERLAAVAQIGSQPYRRDPGSSCELDRAVARMLVDPLAIQPRMELGAMLEAKGLTRFALEQFVAAADLAEDYAAAPLHAARLLNQIGRSDEAAEMARRVLAIDPSSREATDYLRVESEAG